MHAVGLLDTESEEAFDRLAEMARRLLEVPFAFLTVVDDHRSFWKSARGTDPAGPRENRRDESFCQYVVDSGEPLVLGDVRADDRTRDNPSIQSMGVVAWAGFPVRTPDGHVLGTLCAVDTVVRQWTTLDVSTLQDLAAIATREVALRAAALSAERARDRERLFARIGELLTAGLSLPAVWQAIAQLAVPALADVAFVHSVTARTGLQTQCVLHRDPAQQVRARALLDDLPRQVGDAVGPGQVAVTGSSELIEDLAARSGDLTAEQQRTCAVLGVHSSINVPLRARGQLTGVLTVLRTGTSPPYTAADMVLVEAISARAALALDNALAYTQQRSSSLALQEALLPPALPQPDHLQLAARYEPAGTGQVVGGDWYDAFLDGDGVTTLVIGDVAGHDIGAAATMGTLSAMMRMAAHDGELSPAEILTAVDTATEDFGTSVFTTALVARIRPAGPHPVGTEGHEPGGGKDLEITWSSAGHPAPVLARPDGTVLHETPPPDRALGLGAWDWDPDGEPPPARRDHTLHVHAGQTLLLYTDGLVERRDQDLDSGTSRLLHHVQDLAGLPLEQFCDVLLEVMAPDSTDDVALLVLRPHRHDEPLPLDTERPAGVPGAPPTLRLVPRQG